MSGMIDRVAEALARSRGFTFASDGDDKIGKSEFYEAARAAIEAMREPTEEMTLAGTDDYPGEGLKAHGRLMAQTTWEAMVDAALVSSK